MKISMEKIIALLMVVLQVSIVTFMGRTNNEYGVLILLLALVASLQERGQFTMRPKNLIYLCIVLLFVFYGKHVVTMNTAKRYLDVYAVMVFTLIEYSLAVQVILLYWKRPNGISVVFPIGFSAVLMLLCYPGVSTSEALFYQGSVLGFLCLSACFYSARRMKRVRGGVNVRHWIMGTLFLGMVVLSSVGLCRLIITYQDELDEAFNKLAPQLNPVGGVRLSNESKLGSVLDIKNKGGETIALRIYSDDSPGYMRAYAYDHYDPPNWFNSTQLKSEWGTLVEEGQHEKRFAMPLLSKQQDFSDSLVLREIWPHKDIGQTLFTQLQMPFMDVDAGGVEVDGHGTASASRFYPGKPYRCYLDISTAVPGPSDILKPALLDLPESIDPQVKALAEALFTGAETSQEKILRVVGYFSMNYEYEIGIQIPEGVDPLTYFLLEGPNAHCEYFASGAAILLRLGGVPCRYVTGYVAMEQNAVGDYYVARSKDAHAWVEAWDAEQGWVTVEATVADGVPQGESEGKFSQWLDSFKQQWQKFKEAILSKSLVRYFKGLFLGLISIMIELLKQPDIYIVMLVAIALWKLCAYRRRKKSTPPISPEHLACHDLLKQIDQFVAQWGYERDAHETILHFARRLGEAPISQDADEPVAMSPIRDWYRDYSAMRYNPESVMEAGVPAMKAQLQAVMQIVKQGS